MWYIDSLRPLYYRTEDPESAHAFAVMMFAYLEDHVVKAPLEPETLLGIVEKCHTISAKHGITSLGRFCVMLLSAVMVYGKIGNDDHCVHTTAYGPLSEYPLFQKVIFQREWEPTASNIRHLIVWYNRLQRDFLRKVDYIIAPNLTHLSSIINNRNVFFGLLSTLPRQERPSPAFEAFIETLSTRFAPRRFQSTVAYRMPSGDLKLIITPSPKREFIQSPATDLVITPTEISVFAPTPLSLKANRVTPEDEILSQFNLSVSALDAKVPSEESSRPVASVPPLCFEEAQAKRLPSRSAKIWPIDMAVPCDSQTRGSEVESMVVEVPSQVVVTQMTKRDHIEQTIGLIRTFPLQLHLAEVHAALRAQTFCVFFRPRNPVSAIVEMLQHLYNSFDTVGEKAFLMLGILNSNYPELKQGFDLHLSGPQTHIATSDLMVLFEPQKERLVTELSAGLCDLLMDRAINPIVHFKRLYDRVANGRLKGVPPLNATTERVLR